MTTDIRLAKTPLDLLGGTGGDADEANTTAQDIQRVTRDQLGAAEVVVDNGLVTSRRLDDLPGSAQRSSRSSPRADTSSVSRPDRRPQVNSTSMSHNER